MDLIKYIEDAPELPAERVNSWIALAKGKMKLEQELLKDEIAISSMIGSDNLASRIEQYKNIHGQMVERRKNFTTITIDAIKDALMLIEKKYDPKTNAAFIKMVEDELTERKAAANKQNIEKEKLSEESSFRAFITNEYIRVSTAYKQTLENLIHECYQHHLTAKTPVDSVNINPCLLAMAETKAPAFNKFPFKQLQQADIDKILAEIPQPQWQAFYDQAVAALNTKFELYPNDLANAQAIAVELQKQHEQKQAAEKQQADQQVASNNLVAQAGPYIGEEVKIKKKTSIKIVETHEFVVKVMAAFLANFQKCIAEVGNKKITNINIAQMAAALDKAEVTVQGLEYVTTEK